jgi:hypothetical protein
MRLLSFIQLNMFRANDARSHECQIWTLYISFFIATHEGVFFLEVDL